MKRLLAQNDESDSHEAPSFGNRAYLAAHPDKADLRALTLTFDCDKLLNPAADCRKAVLPDARSVIRAFRKAASGAEQQFEVSIRTIRLSLRGCRKFIAAVGKTRGLRDDAAAQWLGDALEALALEHSHWLSHEHRRRTPTARSKLLNRVSADRNREMFVLVELPAVALGDESERTIRLISPVLQGHPHVFVGVTASDESSPASSAALRAVADEVRLLGTDAARLGVNFVPPANGAFFPGTRPTRHGVLSAGVADAEVLTAAILDARRAGAEEELVEETMITAHAEVLRVASEIGRYVAEVGGFEWMGVSTVSAPVNCSDHRGPAWRSSWSTMEALNGGIVGTENVVPATARFNACLHRAGIESGEKMCGFEGSFNPPAEDGLLAERVRQRRITVTDLILQEAVSSAGVDMVVLQPGTTSSQIAKLFAEVACISDHWGKPLTVRVIVPPESAVRTITGDYFLGGLLGAAPAISLPRAYGADKLRRFRTMGRLKRSAS
jgi:uncharacterized protein (UPF0210 family)